MKTRAPLDAADALIANRRLEFGGDGPAETPLAHHGLDDAPINQRGREAATRGFYFR